MNASRCAAAMASVRVMAVTAEMSASSLNPAIAMLCLKTSVTVLHQDIGDTSGGLGGDTSAARLRGWLLMNLSILASG